MTDEELLDFDEINDSINVQWNLENKEIPRVNFLTYQNFFKNFLYINQPCIITDIPYKEWFSHKNWIQNNKPNFKFLKENYGNSKVPIANCKEKYYNSQSKSEMNLSEFVNYWEKCINDEESELLYLKDWHFALNYPDFPVYRVPKYFASDWLNEYLCSSQLDDDYRFVYMGPKNSWTPFHADVFSSFSWSINLSGRKRWILYPPKQEEYLKDVFNHLPYDILSNELKNVEKYPNYSKVECVIDVIQDTGEAIFVPSGWHHQVLNLDETISINHNWINGCNIENMWKALQNHLESVQKEIEDCKEMENWSEHCQIMLKASFGMNYEDFYYFLMFISKRRLECIEQNKPLPVLGDWIIGRNHILFDLKQIYKILTTFFSNPSVKELKFLSSLNEDPNISLEKINKVLF